jgi:hypothetical protein
MAVSEMMCITEDRGGEPVERRRFLSRKGRIGKEFKTRKEVV